MYPIKSRFEVESARFRKQTIILFKYLLVWTSINVRILSLITEKCEDGREYVTLDPKDPQKCIVTFNLMLFL